jgi:hypothetical protein
MGMRMDSRFFIWGAGVSNRGGLSRPGVSLETLAHTHNRHHQSAERASRLCTDSCTVSHKSILGVILLKVQNQAVNAKVTLRNKSV